MVDGVFLVRSGLWKQLRNPLPKAKQREAKMKDVCLVEQKGWEDLQCSVLSLHFSNFNIYVFKIIQKPRQNSSVSALIFQNANIETCNLTLTDPAHSVAKQLNFYSRPVVFLCHIWLQRLTLRINN